MGRNVGRHRSVRTGGRPVPVTPAAPARRRGFWGVLFLEFMPGLLLLVGLLIGVQFGWAYYGVGLDVTYQQHKVAEDLGWEEPETQTVLDTSRVASPQAGDPPVASQPAEGKVMGWMYIPRFGYDWKRAIQQGTTKVVLDNLGLGHYEETPMPGALGNTAYAGHRLPSDLGYADQLEVGDVIAIRTYDTWYVYKVSKQPWIVYQTERAVIGQDTGGRQLTLTTCDPMFSRNPASNRLIVRADFSYWAKVSDGTPKELLEDGGMTTTTVGVPVKKIRETVQRTAASTPITPLLAALCLGCWLLVNAVMLLVSSDRWSRFRTVRDPMTLLWRVNYGPLPVRIILMGLLAAGIVFVMFSWVCPWLATVVPAFDSPHADLGTV